MFTGKSPATPGGQRHTRLGCEQGWAGLNPSRGHSLRSGPTVPWWGGIEAPSPALRWGLRPDRAGTCRKQSRGPCTQRGRLLSRTAFQSSAHESSLRRGGCSCRCRLWHAVNSTCSQLGLGSAPAAPGEGKMPSESLLHLTWPGGHPVAVLATSLPSATGNTQGQLTSPKFPGRRVRPASPRSGAGAPVEASLWAQPLTVPGQCQKALGEEHSLLQTPQ